MNLRKYGKCVLHNLLKRRSFCNSSYHLQKYDYDLRNIGILAHIDAGKTTTTERMLFYSGTIRSMGEVHHGNTVTDYMTQERERGITITAAAVSFGWKDCQFNLIDTPGHIDFTMEVEQSLGVLDGAVVVLDGSAGVEAQTLTVWRQCDGHCIPRLVYANKMDRKDGDIELCLDTLKSKLDVRPLCLQLPVRNDEMNLTGIIDVVNLEKIVWSNETQGKKFVRRKLTEESDGRTWENTMLVRSDLADALSETDDTLADIIINSESLDTIDAETLKKSIRKVTLNCDACPVLCGSSYKNIGVQTLMDAVIDYLPSPSERNHYYECFGNELCAKAFKVQHDDRKGVLTYFRIFSGQLTKLQKIYNIGKEKSEQGSALYIPYADEYETVLSVGAGNVAAVSGLKLTMTGDIISSSQTAASNAKKNLINQLKDENKKKQLQIPPYLWNRMANETETDTPKPEDIATCIFGIGTTIPPPVFYCSIEPPSLASQTALEVALAELQREDSSLRLTNNTETGQMVLAGMGELHLEVIKQRILTEYKIDADLGPLQISYKETLTSNFKETHVSDNKIGGNKHLVNLTMSAYPANRKDILKLDQSTVDSASNLSRILPRHMHAIRQGIDTALLHGPKLGCPLIDIGVTLHWLEIGRGTSDTFISAAVTQCLRKVFNSSECILMEPTMYLEVVCEENHSSMIINDLNKRRSLMKNIASRGQHKVVECVTPLAELLGYSSFLRTITSGTATFTMEFHNNQQMGPLDEDKAVRSVRGY